MKSTASGFSHTTLIINYFSEAIILDKQITFTANAAKCTFIFKSFNSSGDDLQRAPVCYITYNNVFFALVYVTSV